MSLKTMWNRRAVACQGFLIAALMLTKMPSASANPELFATYDSRSAALGGTGASYQTNAAASVHNAALLSGINRFNVTATFSPYALRLKSPFMDMTTGQNRDVTSKWALGPLAQLGAAVRLHKRVVIGANVFLPLGLRSKYENAPFSSLIPKLDAQTQLAIGASPAAALTVAALMGTSGTISPTLLMGELIIPISVEITDFLSLAAGYRMTYAYQGLTAQVDGATVAELSSSAKNFGGYDIGVWFHPNKIIQAGVSYRSKVQQNYKLDKLVLPQTLAPVAGKFTGLMDQEFVAPHLVRLGVSSQPLGDRLLFAGDYRYYFYHNANPKLDDAWSLSLGAEVRTLSVLAFRVGGAYGPLATKSLHATPFAPPPGGAWIVTAGAGIDVAFVEINAAVGYGQEGSGTVAGDPADASHMYPVPGKYHDQAIMASLSANFHF